MSREPEIQQLLEAILDRLDRIDRRFESIVSEKYKLGPRSAAELAQHFAVYGNGRDQNATYDKGWADCAHAIAAALRRCDARQASKA